VRRRTATPRQPSASSRRCARARCSSAASTTPRTPTRTRTRSCRPSRSSSKLGTAIVGPGEPIQIPARETHTDYEVELAVVIGTTARRVPRERALEHVFGFTVANDVSARDVQFKDMQITLGKNPDTFCPLGPAVVTADAIDNPSDLEVACFVNGEERQRGHTSDWLFDVPTLIEFVSRTMTLEPGDLVTTGTPAGVAAFRDGQPWLAPGDEVVVEVERVGRLENPVVAGWTD
jgi:2-keto-4-pentenoate hydratase/2-oxohepta-3-ene-1,7-dioic acid hydratase in catechol pathway